MNAIICDRCGKVWEKAKRGQRKYVVREIKNEVVRKQMSRGVEVDLCGKCYAELIVWLDTKRGELL